MTWTDFKRLARAALHGRFAFERERRVQRLARSHRYERDIPMPRRFVMPKPIDPAMRPVIVSPPDGATREVWPTPSRRDRAVGFDR